MGKMNKYKKTILLSEEAVVSVDARNIAGWV